MPPRPMLPADDLYARLELPVDASYEAVEVAWRALLKRHHPDVAHGAADAGERAKRINVAHDWLSDPELRARYDRERHGGRDSDRNGARGGGRRSGTWHGGPAAGPLATRRPTAARATSRPVRRRPADTEEALARHLERVERLTPDDIDRLTLAETPPIAFVASIERFLSRELMTAVDSVEPRVHERLPRAVRWNAGVRDSAVGFGQEIVLGPFLDEHLSAPFRERVQERLTRGWSSGVDQPRYGPNTAEVARAIARVGTLSTAELAGLAERAAAPGPTADGAANGTASGRGSPPWPPGLRPDEDDALRVSSDLARRDAMAALRTAIPPAARRSLERAVHALVLRHAFSASAFDDLVRPWREALAITAAPRPGVRANRHPRS